MLDYIQELYDEHIQSKEDPRIKDLPFMSSPKNCIIMVTLYLIFIKYIGPQMMKNRKPFELKGVIIAYNAFQTFYSATIFIVTAYNCHKVKFNYLCMDEDHDDLGYHALALVYISWVFMMARFVEFLDTVFFILRKKNNQVTTLHVFHHALVPLICWVGVKTVPGGHFNVAGYINAFVHTFMYLYYLLAALGPEYKKYLWWKKYMTIIQLTQFIVVITHTILALMTECKTNKTFGYLILFQAVLFFKMFLDFYKGAFKGDKLSTNNGTSFGIEQYLQKFRKFMEMCIPNQNELFDDSTEKNEEKTKEKLLKTDGNCNINTGKHVD